MTHATWLSTDPTVEVAAVAAISGIVVAALGTLGTWISNRKTREKVEEVRVLAEPTGNGYAQKTLEALARIEDRQLLADHRAERIAAELAAYREAHAREHAAEHEPPAPAA